MNLGRLQAFLPVITQSRRRGCGGSLHRELFDLAAGTIALADR
jgi:hypothetical protein